MHLRSWAMNKRLQPLPEQERPSAKEADGLTKTYQLRGIALQVVRGISFTMEEKRRGDAPHTRRD